MYFGLYFVYVGFPHNTYTVDLDHHLSLVAVRVRKQVEKGTVRKSATTLRLKLCFYVLYMLLYCERTGVREYSCYEHDAFAMG